MHKSAALCRPQATGCSVAQRNSLSPGIAVHQRGAQRRNREGRDRPRQKNAAESDSDRKYARERLPRHEIAITDRGAGDEGDVLIASFGGRGMVAGAYVVA